jgi:hypothetical protein
MVDSGVVDEPRAWPRRRASSERPLDHEVDLQDVVAEGLQRLLAKKGGG